MTCFVAALFLVGPTLPIMQATLPQDDIVTAPEGTGNIRSLELTWPGNVRFDLENDGYEIVLRFDRPIAESALKAFAEAAGDDLAELRWNDDSLVMRAAVGRRLEASVGDRVLHVRFRLDHDAQPPLPASTDAGTTQDEEVELALARAEADAAAGYPDRARRRLTPLAKKYPENKRIQRMLADVEVAEGALTLGAMRYREIAADDPFARRAIAEAGGSGTAAVTLRGGKVFSQLEGGVNALVPVSSTVSAGAGYRYVRSKADIVFGPSGPLTDVVAHSSIADLLATIDLGRTTRLELQGSAQIDEKVVGAGARLFAGPPERQGRLVLAYRLPDVATPEQSAFGGHISRAGLGGTLRLTPELLVQVDGAWNGYGLAGGGVRARTVTVSGGLDYLLRRGSPSLAATYRLDAEYVDTLKQRSNGLAFIPLSDRENHSFQLVSGMSWTKWQLTGAAGWTFDRKGKTNGPTANISATGRLGTGWRLQASGGISSVSRPGISGRQLFLRLALTRYFGRF